MFVLQQYEIEIYTTFAGEAPFIEWLESLDNTVQERIKQRLNRIMVGNLGDYKVLQGGVSEFRFPFGPGYRVYYGLENQKIILLLCGGGKSSQQRDIKKAIIYLNDYLRGKLWQEQSNTMII